MRKVCSLCAGMLAWDQHWKWVSSGYETVTKDKRAKLLVKFQLLGWSCRVTVIINNFFWPNLPRHIKLHQTKYLHFGCQIPAVSGKPVYGFVYAGILFISFRRVFFSNSDFPHNAQSFAPRVDPRVIFPSRLDCSRWIMKGSGASNVVFHFQFMTSRWR